ncbi:LysR family transcriptional regulator [Rhodoligotrophos defluvii]|uniref:LysR family transcriptional regulator n=1 Tax=Rhodoligotrophos defluvii TaxID=2561934 RepID=UPI001485242D|nr:LysR family transcriptional regulator [Rhodoligotrophos defluvii]
MKLSQIRYFVAVYEEGSFTAAARRENATQSGLSMQIKELEAAMGAVLFIRQSSGVVPTRIGNRLYEHATQLLRQVSDIKQDISTMAGAVTGQVHVGLMPTFTRAVLAPALLRFTTQYPHVNVRITEAYSGVLSERVADRTLDFAMVPAGQTVPGIASRYLGTDREYLLTSVATDREHLSPVRLAEEKRPLRLIVPSQANARRIRIENYLQSIGARVSALLEMDAMMGTLELVAKSEWVTILPGVLCAPDQDGRVRKLHPLVDPVLDVGYVLIEPATRSLSPVARLFADALAEELERLISENTL